MPKWYCLLCLEEGKAHTVEAHFPLCLQLFLDRENPQELSLARGALGGRDDSASLLSLSLTGAWIPCFKGFWSTPPPVQPRGMKSLLLQRRRA